MKRHEDLIFQKLKFGNHSLERAEEYFDNGFGVSVIQFPNDTTYEIGILEHQNGVMKTVKFSTMFDGPLIPKLNKKGVTLKLIEIQEYLNYGLNRENENGSERKIKQSGDETTAYNF